MMKKLTRPPNVGETLQTPKRRREQTAEDDRRPEIGAQVVLEVAELTHTGEAIARIGKYVIFLRGALPGEQVRALMTHSKTRFGRARLTEILRPSPNRVAPRCRHFGTCGRCSLQHLSYPEQLAYKEELLRKTLAYALPDQPLPIRPIVGAREPWGTRNKAHFVLGEDRGRLFPGHFMEHSRELVRIEECPVHHPAANAAAKAVVAALAKRGVRAFHDETGRGAARDLVVRTSQATGRSLALIVTADPHLPNGPAIAREATAAAPSIAGVHQHVNPSSALVVIGSEFAPLAGAERIVERVAGLDFHLSPTAFFQTNAAAAEELVSMVLRAVPPSACGVLDLYCGIGLFSLPLARRGCRVFGVEQNPQAVQDAAASAELNGVSGCEFVAGKTEYILKTLPPEWKFDAVVMDPPRNGAPDWVLRLIAQRLRPSTIVNVSCEPASLARDLVVLTSLGYLIDEIQPLDMFPHTSQIETVAVLKRKRTPQKVQK